MDVPISFRACTRLRWRRPDFDRDVAISNPIEIALKLWIGPHTDSLLIGTSVFSRLYRNSASPTCVSRAAFLGPANGPPRPPSSLRDICRALPIAKCHPPQIGRSSASRADRSGGSRGWKVIWPDGATAVSLGELVRLIFYFQSLNSEIDLDHPIVGESWRTLSIYSHSIVSCVHKRLIYSDIFLRPNVFTGHFAVRKSGS